jgi:uncharacterized membrane protein YfcA
MSFETTIKVLTIIIPLIVFLGSISRMFFHKKNKIILIDILIKSIIYSLIALIVGLGGFNNGNRIFSEIPFYLLAFLLVLSGILFTIESYYKISNFKINYFKNIKDDNPARRVENTFYFSFFLFFIVLYSLFSIS